LAAGVPYRALSKQFNLSPSAISRHTKHLTRQRQIEQRQADQSFQDGILEKLALLDHRLDRLFNSALDLRSLNVSLGCVRESLRLLSLAERCRLGPGAQS
jgi:hypothetical protein